MPKTNLLTPRDMIVWVLVLTVLIESLTAFCRFVLCLEATRDTASTVGRFTFGLRIHHAYVGALVLLAALPLWWLWPSGARWCVVAGCSFLISDILHHFVVLQAFTGHHHFDLLYPPGP